MSEARGFAAFGAQRRSTRGRSWWARAWVQALEDTSLDSDQLRKGRRYANSGQVGAITISPGRIAAMVYSPDDTYEAVVQVDELSEDAWRRFLDQVAARAGHIAALLDGDMPHDLVEAAADAGVALLPGIGDLDPTCTCDGWELPCQHAAALCYQVAWLLDDDPFILLLLRGRSREDLLDELQARSSSASRAEKRPSQARRLQDVLAAPVRELPDAARPAGEGDRRRAGGQWDRATARLHARDPPAARPRCVPPSPGRSSAHSCAVRRSRSHSTNGQTPSAWPPTSPS